MINFYLINDFQLHHQLHSLNVIVQLLIWECNLHARALACNLLLNSYSIFVNVYFSHSLFNLHTKAVLQLTKITQLVLCTNFLK